MNPDSPNLLRRAVLASIAGLALGGTRPVRARADRPLRFGAGEFPGDRRYEYAIDLLRALLGEGAGAPTIEPVFGMNQRRTRRALRDGSVDLAILPSLGLDGASVTWIPYPIRRGLLGARLLVVRSADLPRFEGIERLAQLKEMQVALAQDWVETPVLAGLGFRHVECNYRNLFDILRAERVDYVHRAVSEVWLESTDPLLAGSGLSVVPGLALFYPIDDYFVASRAYYHVLERIAAAIVRALADGSYWAIFDRHYGDALSATAMATRRVLNVTGFGVDLGTPLELFDVLELSPQSGRFRLPEGLPGIGPLVPVARG